MREIKKHIRILNALMMRELVTRYGREGLGFLWLIAEPLVFCFGVMGLWSVMKPEYEHGVRLAPFIMTGYMTILLFRHMVQVGSGAMQANIGLMHHRSVRPLHIYLSRMMLEIVGGAMAFAVVYLVLLALGSVSPPHDYLKLYSGYLLMGWLSMGFAITVSSLAIRFEVIERILPVSMYLLVPLSGAFVMVDWIPTAYQSLYLLNPLPHTIEMVRDGVFGEFVQTHYNPLYPFYWGVILNVSGMLLLNQTQRYLEVD
jgi:capsular polysaccharide transport system permease protein